MIREDKERMASFGETTGQSNKPPEEKIFETNFDKYLGKKIGKGPTNPLRRKCLGEMPNKHSAGGKNYFDLTNLSGTKYLRKLVKARQSPWGGNVSENW